MNHMKPKTVSNKSTAANPNNKKNIIIINYAPFTSMPSKIK